MKKLDRYIDCYGEIKEVMKTRFGFRGFKNCQNDIVNMKTNIHTVHTVIDYRVHCIIFRIIT